MLYIPKDFTHGFLTLSDNSEVFYQVSNFYVQEAVRGLRWNDPAFNIDWPVPVEAISSKDRNFPDFQ
jgi:dTDP-4-dehydrorhamnose 3,5-epimerase